MAGDTNFPTALDDDTSLHDVTDGISTLQAAHHNNLKEAIKAIQEKVGVETTEIDTTLDYRLGHPTAGHRHDGASGQGPIIDLPALGTALDKRFSIQMFLHGSAIVGTNVTTPIAIGRTAELESIIGVLRRAPSGATTSFNVKIGPTALPLHFAAAATLTSLDTPAVTYPSGVAIVLDTAAVGTNDPGQGLSLTFMFRESN